MCNRIVNFTGPETLDRFVLFLRRSNPSPEFIVRHIFAAIIYRFLDTSCDAPILFSCLEILIFLIRQVSGKIQMHVEMRIKGLMLDPVTNMPIIILSDIEGQRILPIWVGFFEANAIALQMENVATPRPMTHDLLKNVISGLNATVKKILVNNLSDNTFYAMIYLEMNGETLAIDSRPSDAIALALRMKSPIFVDEEVIQKAKSIEGTRDLSDSESLQRWLENLRPEELGKYKM